jgi:PAS domain S-box-containing protein
MKSTGALLTPAQLAPILDALPVPAIWSPDPDGTEIRANAAFADFDGCFHLNGRPQAGPAALLARALAGTLGPMDVELERPDGSRRVIAVNAFPLHDGQGAVGGAVAILHDVEALVFPGMLREISMHTPALLFTTDAKGRVDSVNARWTAFIGAPAEDLLGNGWTTFVHADDLPRVQRQWSEHLAAGTPYVSQWRFRRADGTYRWTEIRAEPQCDAGGNVKRWFGSGIDVDAQHRAIEALDFLARSAASVAGAQDVDAILDQLAQASLAGLADISIFDLQEEDGTFRRLVVGSPEVPAAAVAMTGAFESPRPGEAHPIAQAIRAAETIHVPFVDEAFIERTIAPATRREAWRNVDIRSIIAAPMVVADRPLGALTLLRRGASVPFETSDVKVIEEVARRAAVAIENVRLKERELREARDLQAFADMGEAIAEATDLPSTLAAAIHVIVPSRADWGFINLVDDDGDLRVAAVYHADEAKRRLLSAHIGSIYARAVSRPVLDAIRAAGIDSYVVVPLFAGTRVRGTIHLLMESDRRSFTGADAAFLQEFARRLAPAIANAEAHERDRRVARSFQNAALPSSLPEVPQFSFSAIYEAGKTEALVGGDWYDAFTLADGRIVVSIGDVAGSGLLAAVTMSSVRQAIRGAAHVRADPGVMLTAANRALDDPEGRFVTAFVGVIDPLTSTIAYQSAGHPPPVLRLADGTVTEFARGGVPLGVNVEHGRRTHEALLPGGSLLVLYTDGLVESTHDMLEGEARSAPRWPATPFRKRRIRPSCCTISCSPTARATTSRS